MSLEESVITGEGLAAIKKYLNMYVDATRAVRAQDAAAVAQSLMAIQDGVLSVAERSYTRNPDATDDASAIALVEREIAQIRSLDVQMGSGLEVVGKLLKRMVEPAAAGAQGPTFRDSIAAQVTASVNREPIKRRPFP